MPKAQAMIMPKKYFFDKDGNPLAFGKVYTYQAGTTIDKITYTTENGDVANPNPVILNGEGYAAIYLDGSYNIVVDDQNDNNIWTEDPVSSSIAEEWVNCETPIYISSTSFKITGNLTVEYEAWRRVRIDNDTSTYSYSTIRSSSFSGGETTVIITDSVVAVGIIESCVSIVGRDSSPDSAIDNVEVLKIMNATSGELLVTKGYYSKGDGGGANYLIKTTAQAAADGDVIDGWGNHTLTNGLVAILNESTPLMPHFGVVMDGSVESSDALISALAFNVKPTEGTVWIDPVDPIIIDSDKNTAFLGLAKGIMRFQTTIDDGRRLFEYSGQFQTATGFSVGGLNGDLKNFTGMVLGNQTGGTSFVRSQFDAKATFCTGTAIEMRGFLNEVNLLTKNCGRGFKGRELNANTMILRSEDDERGIDIEEIYGTNIEQLTIERVTQQVNSNPSRIDKFIGLNINAMYTEGGGWTTTPLEFGQSVGGKSVNINAGNITGVTDDGKPMISFVNAEAVTANLDVSTGSNPVVVNFGVDCNYVDSKVVGVYSTPDATRNKQFTQDNSLSVQIHSNYSGDTYLDHGLTTFPTKSDSNVVTTEDTSIFRSGDKGVRVTANAGNHLAACSLQRQVNFFEKTANLAGKTIRAYAWVWVPDLPLFANRTIQPAFAISAQGSSSSFPTAQRAMVAGQWNLVESEDLTVPGGWGGVGTDKLSFDFYVGYNTSNFPDATYFITVDSIFVTEVNADIRDIMQGRIRESAKYSGISTDGNRLEIQSQVYHSLTASYINISQGEVYVYSNLPAASGKIGYVCTTGGDLGGAAVFKAFGAIDAEVKPG